MLATMHFLISRSIFMSRLEMYDSMGNLIETSSHSLLLYSASAVLTTVCVGAVLILLQFANAFRKLDNRMPMHGNQSAVISAMCHQQIANGDATQETSDLALQPLMWGVTKSPVERVVEGSDGGIERSWEPGHCGFTTQIVNLPEE
jgi:hypothetical protein